MKHQRLIGTLCLDHPAWGRVLPLEHDRAGIRRRKHHEAIRMMLRDEEELRRLQAGRIRNEEPDEEPDEEPEKEPNEEAEDEAEGGTEDETDAEA